MAFYGIITENPYTLFLQSRSESASGSCAHKSSQVAEGPLLAIRGPLRHARVAYASTCRHDDGLATNGRLNDFRLCRSRTVCDKKEVQSSNLIRRRPVRVSPIQPQPCGVSEIEGACAGASRIEIDKCHRNSCAKDRVAWRKIVVANDFKPRARRSVRMHQSGRRVVKATDQSCRSLKHVIFVRSQFGRHMARQVTEDITVVFVRSKVSRCSHEPRSLEVTEETLDEDAIWRGRTANGFADLHDTERRSSSAQRFCG